MSSTGPVLLGAYGAWIEDRLSAQERKYSFLDDGWSDAATWSREAKKAFAAQILSPELGTPSAAPRAEVTDRRVVDDLVVEELSWRLPFGPPTRACFLKRADAAGRLPGVVALHDHGANKYFGWRKIADAQERIHPHVRDYRKLYYGGRAWANELAKRGFGVLVHDIFPFGSRMIRVSDLPGPVVDRTMTRPEELRELTPESVASGTVRADYDVSREESIPEIDRYNAFAGHYESTIAKALFSAGLSWPGLVLAEDRTALAYLASRPDIDPDRLGCCGLSGGGLRANYLAGTDERVRCSVTAGFMTTWADLALHTAYTHTWMIYIPGLPRLMDFPDILAMRIPLPSLVLATRQDPLFTLAEVRRAEATLAASYRKAGAEDRFTMTYYDGPHRFDEPMQEEAFSWFERWL
ncbi:MAG: hypothetical protein M0Z80_08125 [Treponema sp.]|nr:hypothetical protein [Treponema sp.]